MFRTLKYSVIFSYQNPVGEGDISVPCPIADLSPFQETLTQVPGSTGSGIYSVGGPEYTSNGFDNEALMGLLSQGVNVLVNQVGDNLGQGVNEIVNQVQDRI